MRARLGLIGALVLYAPLLGCGILGFGADIPVSCNDGPRTCADLNTSNPTGQACTFWACIDNRCQVVPKDTDQDGVLDSGCEPEGSPPDCDENDNRRFPGNPEICDYIDNNCNNEVDEGFAYGVSEEHLWPLGNIPAPSNVNFATRSTEQGITLAGTFDYGVSNSQEAGLAVWSAIDIDPDPFGTFGKRIVSSDQADQKPEDVSSWLTTTNYHTMLPVIAGNDLGIVAAATDGETFNRYFAGLVQSEPTETVLRIHEDFHEYDPLWALGEHSNYAAAAWTERGLLVVGIKSCSSACYPSGLSNRDVFVQLLKKDDATQAWTMASSTIDHHRIGKVPDTNPLPGPVIVPLPSGHWLTAHLEQGSAEKIRLTLVKVTDNETIGAVESSLVAELPSAADFTLSVGPTQGDTTTIALSYVTTDSRAHVRFFSLTEAPTPQATELGTVDAPIDSDADLAQAKPLAVFHSELAEWLFVWRDDTRRLGMMRLSQDGTVIPKTFTHALAHDGRLLEQGFGLAPTSNPLNEQEDSGAYALVTYAKDNTAAVFVTGAVGCGIP